MIRRDYLIVGASIAGASACEGIRKYDKRGSVTLVGAEVFPPYKRWILSKSFLRDKEPNLVRRVRISGSAGQHVSAGADPHLDGGRHHREPIGPGGRT